MNKLAAVVQHSIVVVHVHRSAAAIAQTHVLWPRTSRGSELRQLFAPMRKRWCHYTKTAHQASAAAHTRRFQKQPATHRKRGPNKPLWGENVPYIRHSSPKSRLEFWLQAAEKLPPLQSSDCGSTRTSLARNGLARNGHATNSLARNGLVEIGLVEMGLIDVFRH